MLIITEKPTVSRAFAAALNCSYSNGVYFNKEKNITIVNFIGHYLELVQPAEYDPKFTSWDINLLPIIPSSFIKVPIQEKKNNVKNLLGIIKNRKDTIIIATDADREGELIAREFLEYANISDFSNIKRFWVSEALTPPVVLKGIEDAKKLVEYNTLGLQAKIHQQADWLCGINFTRYITNSGNNLFTVGRVQTALLAEIVRRCESIEKFISSTYYEFYGIFGYSNKNLCKGIYIDNKQTKFDNKTNKEKLISLINKKVNIVDYLSEEKKTNVPLLYDITTLQQESYNKFEYTAEKTLSIVQKLYEEYKCVSYPRTPSRVMGTNNVELCKTIFDNLINTYTDFKRNRLDSDISINNKSVFNDRLLDSHHALIPLDILPNIANEEENNIYSLIINRFMLAFLSPEIYQKQTYYLSVDDNLFVVTGKKVIKSGWKEYVNDFKEDDEQEVIQNLDGINFNNLVINDIECCEKKTRPPKYYTEASILAFMKNPKNTENPENLIGIGTQATRHTFIPLLLKREYIAKRNKAIIPTEKGKLFIQEINNSSLKQLCNIETTTKWEKEIVENPNLFLTNIKDFISTTVNIKPNNISITTKPKLSCPLCNSEVKKGKTNWYCTGYKNGCNFVIWEHCFGTTINKADIKNLCSNKSTNIKHCKSSSGKAYNAKFSYDKDTRKIKLEFSN